MSFRPNVTWTPAFRSLLHSVRYNSTAPVTRSKRPLKPLLGRFDHIPVELFRINTSEKVILRAYEEQMKKGRTSYDLHLHEDGLVHPKPGDLFEGPNGMSLRPDGPFLQELIRGFKGKNTIIYRLPEGVQLPEDLVLLHEHSDHHSMQCTVPMTLTALNAKLTDFCHKHGEAMSKMDFIERYPFM